LEAQLKALHLAVNHATTIVNTRGTLFTDRLQDIPNCAREIASHRVRQRAAIALAVVQTQLGHELRTLHPIFLEGEDQAGFNELVVELDEATGIIDAEIYIEDVVNRVFLDE
jgi:hypothetical protein